MVEFSVVSWNIRGVRKAEKKAAVRRVVRNTGVGMLFLQEVKRTKVSKAIVKRLWDKRDVEFEFSPAVGSSGGILSAWDPNFFRKESVDIQGRFIILTGRLVNSDFKCAFINLYAPNNANDRASCFNALLDSIDKLQVPVCLGGDFNTVLSASEKQGPEPVKANMECLAGFIEAAGLVDLELAGSRFTWSNNWEKATWCRLDRFLLDPSFLESFKDFNQEALPRSLSDHCPVLLTVPQENWGAIPFKAFNSWLDDAECEKVIKAACSNSLGFGIGKILKEVKGGIRDWVKRNKQNKEKGIPELEGEIQELEVEIQNGGATTEKSNELILRRRQLWNRYRTEERDWLQKSRLKWFKVGDRNTKFFHLVASGRRRRNRIHQLRGENGSISSPTEVKELVQAHFKKLYTKRETFRISNFECRFPSLKPAQVQELEMGFTEEEVCRVVMETDGNKAPGPDGFNPYFFKKIWVELKSEIMAVLNNFHRTGVWERSLNHAFVTLIPKVTTGTSLDDLRPISLVGGIYKILSKVLANRLSTCMDGLIGEQQFAFVRGRQIIDCSFIANETLDSMRKNGRKGVLFKADFRKAYDSVEWSYLDYVMMRMGFGSRWRKWIEGLLKSASLSVLVNGSPTQWFRMECGLRQECSLSPMLFNLVAESLSLLLKSGVEKGLIKGVEVGGGERISHLQFADDLVVFCEADLDQVKNVVRLLRGFELVSGLGLNMDKTKLYGINLNPDLLDQWANVVGCGCGSFPTDYLGLPLGYSRNSTQLWRPVVERVKKRLSIWKARVLSSGGRLTLIKSVLEALPIYFMSVFRMPASVIAELDSIFSNFFWSSNGDRKRTHWVSWSQMCRPVEAGGLGLKNLRVQNEALLNKWLWRFGSDQGCLWRNVVVAKYEKEECGPVPRNVWNRRMSWVWRDITRPMRGGDVTGGAFLNNILLVAGSDSKIRFWEDCWTVAGKLKEAFPRIFSVALKKTGTVSDFGGRSDGGWRWNIELRRKLFGWEEQLWEEFLAVINSVKVGVVDEDCIRWRGSPDGEYSAKKFVNYINQHAFVPDQIWKHIWASYAPPKVQIFVWQVLLGRIPTRTEIIKRSSLSPNLDFCPLCFGEGESVDHLMFKCPISWRIWMACCNVWSVHLVIPASARTLFVIWRESIPENVVEELWLMIFSAIMWTIWLYRNEVVFNQKTCCLEEVCLLVRTRIAEWGRAIWPNSNTSMGEGIRDPALLATSIGLRTAQMCSKWSPPPIGSVKFNVDGAVTTGSGMGGIGGILRDANQKTLITFSKNVGAADVIMAEVLAIKEAVLIFCASKWNGWTKLIIECDCKEVVEWLSGKGGAPNFVKGVMKRLEGLSKDGWEIKYVSRKANGTADRLAKSGINRSLDLLSIDA